jgi:Na+-transporting NADH:ubiquinone oxidoreductase subunit F
VEPWAIVLLGVGMFAGVILSQVGVLLAAKRWLVPSGAVRIEINDDEANALEVESGRTLLETLGSQGVFIPSACGGKGTCGVCTVKVHAGGGALLPTEESHVSPKEAREGTRLSCQVKVKEDLEIEVPPELFSARKWLCRVRSNRNVATFIKELILELPKGEEVPFRAGGYVQVECKPHTVYYKDFDIDEAFREAWSRYHLFALASTSREIVTRAYSMANYPDEEGVIMLNIRIASPPMDAMHVPPGQMSSYLFNLRPGDEVTISGPFGEFFARDTDAEMCFIGGGAGMAPMRSHILDQLFRLGTTRKITFWYGARSLREAFYVNQFEQLHAEHDNFQWQLVLSNPGEADGWEGPTGWVHTVLLERYLSQHQAPEDIEYYLCGPPAMIDSLQEMLHDLGVERENILFDDFG